MSRNDCAGTPAFWAVLTREADGYVLQETARTMAEILHLADGKYRDADVILTPYAGDIMARIACLNAAAQR